MVDLRFGTIIRAARVKRCWRQRDLSVRAGVSRAAIWRAEHGRVDEMTLASIRRICDPLEIRVELQARGRGADLDRMINARHSGLHESVARALSRDFPEWEMAHEVSFSIWGERGVIDLLLWHPGRRALLIIELKTEIVDTGELLGTMDRRRRLARKIAEERGWDPLTVSAWIVVAAIGPTTATSRSTARCFDRPIPPTVARFAAGCGTRTEASQRFHAGPRQRGRRSRRYAGSGRPRSSPKDTVSGRRATVAGPARSSRGRNEADAVVARPQRMRPRAPRGRGGGVGTLGRWGSSSARPALTTRTGAGRSIRGS